jgi:hypothetical protein
MMNTEGTSKKLEFYPTMIIMYSSVKELNQCECHEYFCLNDCYCMVAIMFVLWMF